MRPWEAKIRGAVAILREYFADLKIRFVNVVDLTGSITKDKPVIFNFHGYPWLIHKFTSWRTNHPNIHVRGYKEKGNINTPLELAIRNQVGRFSLAIGVIERVPTLQSKGAHVKDWLKNQIIDSIAYAYHEGLDKPEICNWKWPISCS